jgi:glycosyltransferase involved in cell wall biosynthesis
VSAVSNGRGGPDLADIPGRANNLPETSSRDTLGPVCILGSRGIPAQYGGFETFAEKFAIEILARGMPVCVIGQEHADNDAVTARGLAPVDIVQTRFTKQRNPLLYYLESALRVPRASRHVLCLGPAGVLAWPILALRGKHMIINLDGLNSRRTKWARWKRFAFRVLELAAARLPCDIVLDSSALIPAWGGGLLGNNRVSVIEYGSDDLLAIGDTEVDQKIMHAKGLTRKGYFLVVARLVAENSIQEIVKAHAASSCRSSLVIVGNWDPESFSAQVLPDVGEDVRFLGAIHDQAVLATLRRNCLGYIHGHRVGGTNPSLVEALAAGQPIIAHGNVFNKATLEGARAFYFDNIEDLSSILDSEAMILEEGPEYSQSGYELFQAKYTWHAIADKYVALLTREKESALHSETGSV